MVAGMHAEQSCRPREESLFITDSPYEALCTVCGRTRRLAAHGTFATITRQPRFRPEVRRIMRGRHQGCGRAYQDAAIRCGPSIEEAQVSREIRGSLVISDPRKLHYRPAVAFNRRPGASFCA